MKKFRCWKINLIVIILIIIAVSGFEPAVAQDNKINLLVDVQPSLALIVTNSSIDFGTLISGTPQTAGHGVKVAVNTNSANGYYLAVADNAGEGKSSLVNIDGITKIDDFTATPETPQPYLTNQSKGLGITVYEATNKESKWGNGSSYDDQRNYYAGVPDQFTVIHNAPGYKNYVDYTSVAFILDLPSSQKTGQYQGSIVLSAVTMLN